MVGIFGPFTTILIPIIILLFTSLSCHPSYHPMRKKSYHPIIPILILLFPSLSYFITWSHFLVTTMALQINCSTFHSFLFGPQQERVEQLISNEQSWPICYLRPLTLTLWGFIQDIPKTHNQSNFRTDTPSGSKWKTLFCSFSEGGRVTEIQFVKSPFAQNEKNEVFHLLPDRVSVRKLDWLCVFGISCKPVKVKGRR